MPLPSELKDELSKRPARREQQVDSSDGFSLLLLSPKRRLTYTRLHGVASQKVEPFILTTVRAPNPIRRE
jgi:hypothetical protein